MTPPHPLPCSGCVGQVIVMVGLPARGKTYIAKKLTRKEDNSLPPYIFQLFLQIGIHGAVRIWGGSGSDIVFLGASPKVTAPAPAKYSGF